MFQAFIILVSLLFINTWLSDNALAYPISFYEFNYLKNRIILIGDYHSNDSVRDPKYLEILKNFLDSRKSPGSQKVLILEAYTEIELGKAYGQVRRNTQEENLDFINRLKLLSHDDEFSQKNKEDVQFILADRRMGGPVEFAAFLMYLNDLEKKQAIQNERKAQIVSKWKFWNALIGFQEKKDETKNFLLRDPIEVGKIKKYVEDLTKPKLSELFEQSILQIHAIEENLISKYNENEPIYEYIASCILELVDNLREFEEYTKGLLPNDDALEISASHLLASSLLKEQTFDVKKPWWNYILQIAAYSGDAYFASSLWDVIHHETKDRTVILVAGNYHIESIGLFLENLAGAPVVKFEGNGDKKPMEADILRSLIDSQ
jgi:hypothetical protein